MTHKDNSIAARICPRCGQPYTGHPALSRADGETPICPDCGTREALESIGKGKEEQDTFIKAIHHAKGEGSGTTEARWPVGGVDRTGEVDRITIQNAVETPFWMAIWATEPERTVDVRMSYSDLKTVCDLIDFVREQLRKGGGTT